MLNFIYENKAVTVQREDISLYEFFLNMKVNSVGAKVNGIFKNLSTKLSELKNDSIIENISPDSPQGLEILRYDTACILAHALKNTYGKSIQLVSGSTNENGFYYDIYVEDSTLSNADISNNLERLEEEMHKIVNKNYKINQRLITLKNALSMLNSNRELLRLELISELDSNELIGVSLHMNDQELTSTLHMNDQELTSTLHMNDQEFVDISSNFRGHQTGTEKYFKLTHTSGVYWRNDAENIQLQRIYGTCWNSEHKLNEHLQMLEKIKEVDHRTLGRKLDLFHIQQEAAGSIFWHKNGWILYKTIENYMRNKINDFYDEVHTPQMIDRKLWELSGHWDHFKQNMFCFESENGSFAIKPMNCPAHVQIFKSEVRSYKDLPLRLFEFGCCHRNEPSGSLHGLMRVKQFVQDDAHIFCTEEQVIEETKMFCSMLKDVYEDFGFVNFVVKFATRPENRAGDDDLWNKMESLLLEGTKCSGINPIISTGDGAFYGPKLEFVIRDALGRDWQCGTVQLDFVMPSRLDINYVNSSNEHVRPMMIHRAILGSMHRFIGILIEHYEGWFPLWLAPIQVKVIPISDANDIVEYSRNVVNLLKNINIRATLDNRSETLDYRLSDNIRIKKIPCVMIIGKKELISKSVSVRIKSNTRIFQLSEIQSWIMSYNNPRSDFYSSI
ncbi:threonine--tRNA ligase [Candidatus Gromoviella agglomerans]|uniref:threonine--tRNA ligase n=1 Tax=Candidatus Gromoviella agglomerans TaxID=2806609 RepID=UPI001E378CBC|nr:threonine--tRNA ligase [Candidatus Gromoviella agglomerans]UFX98174.1 Threonine--tRNA ligase [Candidatus Gromoviella agglomerans]